MKVLFLDFDGVLNSYKYLKQSGGEDVSLDPVRLALLKGIIDQTGAFIVLTTSCREHWDKNDALCDETGHLINKIFGDYGLKIFDKTPYLGRFREQEIEAWLNNNNVEGFVALDDAVLEAEFLAGHFVKTSIYKGLEEEDAEKAISMLTGGAL